MSEKIVLVVDDDADLRGWIRWEARSAGKVLNVLLASNFYEAVGMFDLGEDSICRVLVGGDFPYGVDLPQPKRLALAEARKSMGVRLVEWLRGRGYRGEIFGILPEDGNTRAQLREVVDRIIKKEEASKAVLEALTP